MPMTSWEDIAGVDCVDCGGPATHYYTWGPICCECHLAWAELQREKEILNSSASSDVPSADDLIWEDDMVVKVITRAEAEKIAEGEGER